MKHYRYIPDEATADVAFEATGKTLEELFVNCANALTAMMVEPKTVTPTISKKITLENTTEEKLLFDFLQELVYLKDADYALFTEIKVKIVKIEKNKTYKLTADIRGETIDPTKHKLGNDVKAIT